MVCDLGSLKNHEGLSLVLDLKPGRRLVDALFLSQPLGVAVVCEQQRKQRILFVDDDIHMMKGLIWILEDEGFEVLAIDNVEEALQILQDQCIDFLILDLLLPSNNDTIVTIERKIDDLWLFRKIREELHLTQLPVLVHTAAICLEIIEKLRNIDMRCNAPNTRFESKPSAISDIIKIVREALG